MALCIRHFAKAEGKIKIERDNARVPKLVPHPFAY